MFFLTGKKKKEKAKALSRALDDTISAEKRFRPLANKHARLIEKIGQMYTVASNLYDVNGPQMQKVIDLCLQDIALLPDYRDAYKRLCDYNNRYYQQNPIGNYQGVEYYPIDSWDSYRRLAIILEKQKQYKRAIEVCEQAISNGITKDGTAGGFVGRAAKLTRKMLNQNKRIGAE